MFRALFSIRIIFALKLRFIISLHKLYSNFSLLYVGPGMVGVERIASGVVYPSESLRAIARGDCFCGIGGRQRPVCACVCRGGNVFGLRVGEGLLRISVGPGLACKPRSVAQ